jgi:hypothetical protein
MLHLNNSFGNAEYRAGSTRADTHATWGWNLESNYAVELWSGFWKSGINSLERCFLRRQV